MSRKRIWLGVMRRYKTAICPLCNSEHHIFGRYWLIPVTIMDFSGSEHNQHEGYQSEFYCDIEQIAVVKQYSLDFRYIGYYTSGDIPF